jgi:hypothetical protein
MEERLSVVSQFETLPGCQNWAKSSKPWLLKCGDSKQKKPIVGNDDGPARKDIRGDWI